jgi:release factor H-coupled RctB family protein
VKWAELNRKLICEKFLTSLGTSGKIIFDICHNNVVKKKFLDEKEYWLHRKGAAPSDKGPLIIPGSRGSHSYLVVSNDETSQDLSGYSLAHGVLLIK